MRKAAGYIVIALTAIIVFGFVYQFAVSQSERQRYSAPGEIYDVNGIGLHIDCRGEGKPTVVLEAGLTTGSLSWDLVHDDLAAQTRVCAYDRPGIDWSEPVDKAQNASDIASQLNSLLEVANIDGQLVLVGMSAGGVYVREFFARFPDDVAGMVLVDSAHEQQGNRLSSEADGGTAEVVESFFSMCSWLQPVGLVRMAGLMDELIDGIYGPLPEDTRNAVHANVNQSHTCAALLMEWRVFEQEIHDAGPPVNLGDLPLIVLSQGKPPEANEDFGVSLQQAQLERREWNILQEELAGLSSVAERRIALESGHAIQFDQPEIVLEAVSEIVTKARVTAMSDMSR